MRRTIVRYVAADRVRDVIDDNNVLLLVLNRFRIPFGFGNRTIREVCDESGVDCPTFVAVANFVSNHEYDSDDVSLPALTDYLREAHAYILDYMLPEIRKTLINGVHSRHVDDAGLLMLRFFDEYVDEVRNHMEYENSVVFPYVERLQVGVFDPNFRIGDFATKHDCMTSKLDELKNIFMQHYHQPNTRLLNRALFDILACADDLFSHCGIEERLLVPAVERLEKKMSLGKPAVAKPRAGAVMPSKANAGMLSRRERDIVRLVAYGMSNKEIAEKLCLSFHTITTYRKKLSSKLHIHSSAGLTIFAILHGIIDVHEVEL